jgi:pilus assembly protein CpaB
MPLKIPYPSVWLALAALASGGLAFYGAQRYLTDSSAEVQRSWQERYVPRDVLVAARDLDAGRPLATADVARRSIPSSFVPGGALVPDRLTDIVGKPLLLPLRAGDPIVDSLIAGRNEAALAARLRDGARAVTVPVDEVSSQAGLVRPGDRVDLMLAEELSEGDERCIRVKPLLESLSVLATGRVQGESAQGAEAMLRRGIDVSSYSTITLDVTPEQAQQLALALRVGELIPLLRGDDDESPLSLAERVEGRPNCAPPPAQSTRARVAAPRRGRNIELIIGGESAAKRSELWVPFIVARTKERTP